jgi:hypothetical protein
VDYFKILLQNSPQTEKSIRKNRLNFRYTNQDSNRLSLEYNLRYLLLHYSIITTDDLELTRPNNFVHIKSRFYLTLKVSHFIRSHAEYLCLIFH